MAASFQIAKRNTLSSLLFLRQIIILLQLITDDTFQKEKRILLYIIHEKLVSWIWERHGDFLLQ